MRYRVVTMKWITRSFVRDHHDRIFLFGDNLTRQGYGGQAAAMRGEPNAVGIPTKKLPSDREAAFFSDEEFEKIKLRSIERSSVYHKSVRPHYRSSSSPQTVSEPAELNSKHEPLEHSLIYKSV